MATKLEEYRRALGLPETATVADVMAAFAAELQGEMTPEEIQAEKDRKKKEADAAAAKDAGGVHMMSELREVLGISATVTGSELIAAAKAKLAGEQAHLSEVAGVKLQLKELTDKVAVLEPMAQKAQKLEQDAKLSERTLFLSEQLRAGKLLPSEKEFYEGIWLLDEAKVRAHFKDRKPVVALGERGISGKEDATLIEDADPRQALRELIEKRMSEKKLSYAAAMDEIKAEHKELVEKIAAMTGPGA